MSQHRPEVSAGTPVYIVWRWTTAAIVAIALGTQSLGLQASGPMHAVDTTGDRPSSNPGQVLGRLVPLKWDTRALPIKYSLNTTLDPIPNPLGAPVITLAQAKVALKSALDVWNAIPTSFIDMRITGTTAKAEPGGFDFVNEINFSLPGDFGYISYSSNYHFPKDLLLADGDDVDGDGDADVSTHITVFKDVDGDGDLEVPPGLYKAGTILDNDVEFSTDSGAGGTRFTVEDGDIDTNRDSVDLMAMAVHEFGHSHGLGHSPINQISPTDGRGARMFPTIDTQDPVEELGGRSLSTDDIAWSSYLYPEGTAASGPAALQKGDVRFSSVYGLITGSITHGVWDVPVAGAHVFAIDERGDRVVASAISGTAQISVDPETGARYLSNFYENVLDGRYVIPVPKGRYAVGIEAIDGSPAPSYDISINAGVGDLYGLLDFQEEFYDRREDDVEARPGEAKPVIVLPGLTRHGIDIVTPVTVTLSPFGTQDSFGFLNATPGYYYAVRIPASVVAAINPDEHILAQSIAFHTQTWDSSVVPMFEEAMLTTGVVRADGTASVDLAHPLDRQRRFAGQAHDLGQMFLRHPRALGWRIRHGIANGSIENLFLVLRLPTRGPFPGASGKPPMIGLDYGDDVGLYGLSYTSEDGGTFVPEPRFNFMFSLILSEPPARRR